MDREALLRAICEAPEDDLPRLAYADWCEENGQEDRGTFIRCQLRLAEPGMGVCACWPDCICERCQLLVRQAIMLDSGWRQWGPTPWTMPTDVLNAACQYYHDDDKTSLLRFRFSRGFAERAELSSSDFLATATDLCLAMPVRRIVLTDCRARLLQPVRHGPKTWCWYKAKHMGNKKEAQVPRVIWKHLVTHESRHATQISYDAIAEANESLSAACLVWGRKLAFGRRKRDA